MTCKFSAMSHGVLSHNDAWCTGLSHNIVMADARQNRAGPKAHAILSHAVPYNDVCCTTLSHIDPWYTALNHTDAWCTYHWAAYRSTVSSHILMHDAQPHWILMHSIEVLICAQGVLYYGGPEGHSSGRVRCRSSSCSRPLLPNHRWSVGMLRRVLEKVTKSDTVTP